MLEAAIDGLLLVLQWPAIGYMLVGILVGLYVGAVPGLGSILALTLLLPFTFGLDPVPAFALLLGAYVVVTTSDTIASVLLGVPGTAGSQATILDGHPLALRGEAQRAFGAAFSASAIGGVLGAIVLALSLPLARPLIMSFAQPEFFVIGVIGLSLIGALSGSSVTKGMLAALIGLLLSMIGYSSQGGEARFYYGVNYLLDGLPLEAFALGLFAVPELVALAISRIPIGERLKTADGTSKTGLMTGIRDTLAHPWLVFKSAVIGIYIGFLPGMGAAIADWVAYAHAIRSVKDSSNFGKGDIRGVIAPETANNAVRGGGMVPTVVFGIPGSAGMAILLGAFLIQGLTPGPSMLTFNAPITFAMVWIIAIANAIGALLLMAWSRQIARVTLIRSTLIVPSVIILVLMGSWVARGQLADWYVLLIFGAIGLFMKYSDWPRPPLVLGFILGPIMENALDISYQAFGYGWLLRPMTLLLIAIAAIAIASAIYRSRRDKREGNTIRMEADTVTDPVLSLGMAVVAILVFAFALKEALGWTWDAALFPIVLSCAGVLMAAIVAVSDLRTVRAARSADAPQGRATPLFSESSLITYGRSARALGWLVLAVPLTMLFGQLIALPAIVFLYLKMQRERTMVAVLQTVISVVFLYVFFEKLFSVNWYRSILFN